MCEKLPFFHSPAVVRKGTFFTIFFSSNIDTDHRSVHLGWLIWVFWECMVKKMINFQAQWHIKEFYNSNFFEFWFFCFKITPMAIWECISWLPGFIGKMRRNENDFFLEVSCVKNYHFFTAPRWSEKALFCTIFFLRILILITGRCIWGGLFEFFENLWWKKW